MAAITLHVLGHFKNTVCVNCG